MKIEWTVTGPGTVTLGDDSVKHACLLEQIGGQGLAQIEPAYGSASQFMEMRGNLAGECVFWAQKAHADLDAAATFFNSEYGRIGQKGSLKITFSAHFLTMVNAVLKGVSRLQTDEAAGLSWRLRYTFGITTMTYT